MNYRQNTVSHGQRGFRKAREGEQEWASERVSESESEGEMEGSRGGGEVIEIKREKTTIVKEREG
jgi:hypothetical protein